METQARRRDREPRAVHFSLGKGNVRTVFGDAARNGRGTVRRHGTLTAGDACPIGGERSGDYLRSHDDFPRYRHNR